MWYKRGNVMQNKGLFNFYITTDFATSEKTSADYSVIFVWAYNNKGDWFWVDGVLKRQLMDANIDDLFRLAQLYKPQQTGIEVTGQQGGFIPWIKNEMITRNVYFTLASENNSNKEGIRPVTNKLQRFNIVVPWFKTKKMYFPEEMKEDPIINEITEELSLVSLAGIKARHDDAIDTISQLGSLAPWKPSAEVAKKYNKESNIWEDDFEVDDTTGIDSYIV